MLKRIAIIGPESTGKTRLAQNLSAHYKTKMVEEYARMYFDGREYRYDADVLVEIAKGQLKIENDIARTSKDTIFCDTDFIVMKIWAKVVFGFVPEWIEKQISKHVYNLYLLCYPDLEWEPDPLRSNPNDRQYIYDLFVRELNDKSFNYKVVMGDDDFRLNNAISFVDELLKNGK